MIVPSLSDRGNYLATLGTAFMTFISLLSANNHNPGLKASGLKTARTLAELMPHLAPWLDHEGLTSAQTDLRGQR